MLPACCRAANATYALPKLLFSSSCLWECILLLDIEAHAACTFVGCLTRPIPVWVSVSPCLPSSSQVIPETILIDHRVVSSRCTLSDGKTQQQQYLLSKLLLDGHSPLCAIHMFFYVFLHKVHPFPCRHPLGYRVGPHLRVPNVYPRFFL